MSCCAGNSAPEYVRANNGSWWAGFAVAQVMREMGYVEAGTASAGPVGQRTQGTVWKPRADPKMPRSGFW